MMSGSRRLEVQKYVGYVLMALVVVGLIYLAHWVITAEPRSRYPGIEKLRGEAIPLVVPGALATATPAQSGAIGWYA